MSEPWDVIIIGSGFGGAVTACRLAAAGMRVLVLERGRRWTKPQYPRKPGDAWVFDHANPQRHNGWLDVRLFRHMAVAMGAGVGGGSLCYSSVLLEPHPERFEHGWPPEVTPAELAPHFEAARRMLGARTIPSGQVTHRSKLLQRGATRAGMAERFARVPLALSFDDEYTYDRPNPLDYSNSRPFVNAQGGKQGTCVHLGNCDVGCDVGAKNTLDLNYLAAAEASGARVRPLHTVRSIEPLAGRLGYRVRFMWVEGPRMVEGSEKASRVILAAGSLGSTELLLRCREQYRTLPNVSARLGFNWSPNANVLTPDRYGEAHLVHQSIGPTISSSVDFSDGSVGGERFVLEDDGVPNMLANAFAAESGNGVANMVARLLHLHLRRGLDESNPLERTAIWLGAGVDGGDGRLFLGRSWLRPWRDELKLDWAASGRNGAVLNAIYAMQAKISRANGGKLRVPLYWRLFKYALTVHPLGGCAMAKGSDEGVVDHRGEVFGYKGLFVCDGAAIPRPVGRNPSLLIAALAERAAKLMLESPTAN